MTGLAHGVRLWRAAPWCPVVVMVEGELWKRDVETLRPNAMSVTFLVSPRTTMFPDPEQCIALLRARSPSTIGQLLAYVSHRCGLRSGDEVARAFESHADDSTKRRRLRNVGPWSTRDWAGALNLVRGLDIAFRDPVRSRESVADELGVSAKTLLNWAQRYLGDSWRNVARVYPWEASLEGILRRAVLTGEAGSRARLLEGRR